MGDEATLSRGDDFNRREDNFNKLAQNAQLSGAVLPTEDLTGQETFVLDVGSKTTTARIGPDGIYLDDEMVIPKGVLEEKGILLTQAGVVLDEMFKALNTRFHQDEQQDDQTNPVNLNSTPTEDNDHDF